MFNPVLQDVETLPAIKKRLPSEEKLLGVNGLMRSVHLISALMHLVLRDNSSITGTAGLQLNVGHVTMNPMTLFLTRCLQKESSRKKLAIDLSINSM